MYCRHIMSVKMYRWNCSGDWGLQILSLRAACWPALLYALHQLNVLWYYFNIYLCYLCNSQFVLLGYLTVAPVSSKLPFWKHMNLKSDKEGSSDTCKSFTRFLTSRSLSSFTLLNTKVGLLLLLKICRFKVTKYSINPYPTAFPYGNGMVLHFYQQQESSTTKTVHKVITKGLKTYV